MKSSRTLLCLLLVAALSACAAGEEGQANVPDLGGRDDGGRDDVSVGSYCGDGVVDPGEACDDGNAFDGDSCSSTCAEAAVCGDGLLDRNEQCDDGNRLDGDGCSSVCERESGGGAACGDAVVERGEECDGADLAGASCQSRGFSGGVLTCDGTCKYDTSGCVSGAGCGDGVVSDAEECDGTNLGRTTCAELGFSGGTLGCVGDCQFDTSACTRDSGACGDGNIDRGETCDGANLAGESCDGLGFAGGTLSCREDCLGFNQSECVESARCGDGVVNGEERCDGDDLGREDCASLGFVRGTLQCAADCSFDTRACESGSGGRCGDGAIDAGETCDGIALGGETCDNQGFSGGELGCSPDCLSYDIEGCTSEAVPAEWTCAADYYGTDDGCDCGCGALDPDCEDDTVAACEFCGNEGACNVGPCPGTIEPINNAACDASVGVCGDGLIGSGEACDGESLGDATCESLGLEGGELACAVNCLSLDTTGCTGGGAPAEWTCDVDYYGTADGCDCGCGVVDPDCATELVDVCVFCDSPGSCNDALCPGAIDPTNNAACVDAGSCGDGVIDSGEACDGAELGGATCESLGLGAGTLGCDAGCGGFDTSGCDGGTEVPAEWSCSDFWYGDGADCDCGCGAFDPDCDDATVDSCDYCANLGACNDGPCPGAIEPESNWQCVAVGDDCGNGSIEAGEICDGANLDGQSCAALGLGDGELACGESCLAFDTSGCSGGTVPDAWFCDPTYFGTADGCDCECGAYDPDCDDPGATLFGCAEGETCDADGLCAGGGSVCGDAVVDLTEACDGDNLGDIGCVDLGFTGGELACGPDCLDFDTTGCTGSTVPAEWVCNPAYYGTNDGCDCECGAYDPDCDDPATPLFGCAAGETCDADGLCVGGGGPDCGNGAIDLGEACDGADLADETCETQGLTGGELACASDCLSFDTSGCTGGSAPPEWVCPESYYVDGELCDCDCGAYDPDCDDPALPVDGCAGDQTCDESGLCVGGGEVPPGWTCLAEYYAAEDGCDCECGAYDPDCDDPTATVWNCIPGQTCDVDGLCAGDSDTCGNGAVDAGETCDGLALGDASCASLGLGTGELACAADCSSYDTSGCSDSAVPAEWICVTDYYNAADGCDCDCGAYDPDCDDPDQAIYNCLAGEICDSNGVCTGGGGVPPGWTCFDAYYGDAEYCDCECGAYDPDCDDASLPIDGCAAGETCDDSGVCTGGGGGGVPPGWICDASFYDALDGCDCDCGAYDPDCDDPDQTVYNCLEGWTCDSTGVCVGGDGPPASWFCNPDYYDALDGCDCECGAYDPDCDDPSQEIFGCLAGQTCDSSGTCVD